MIVNSLPPQAYTKETLQKAYTWLLNQSPSVKDLATNQETLVSLYLRAVRNGEVVQQDSPSVQNFKQELKSLATLMGDLQMPGAAPAPAPVKPAPAVITPTPPVPPARPSQLVTAPTSSLQVNLTEQLDAQSLETIREVKLMLNLGSDIEALRALIALGHRQFKKI
jgi:hypothetical protein